MTTFPFIVNSHPEVASAGKTEQQVKETSIQYKARLLPLSAADR